MNIYDLWFSSIQLSNRIKLLLLKNMINTEQLWNYTFYVKDSITINEKIRYYLKKAWDKVQLESLYTYLSSKGIGTVVFNEKVYPKNLKNIIDAPAIIFYKGDINGVSKKLSVGIVGSRNCSVYGENVAEIISKELSIDGMNIVSGMARGIDSFAHKACLKQRGYTCAVLGSGIDVVYPKENKKIYDKISENGCVLSEFLPGTKPLSRNFPIRNRIISGLSDLIIVVEAGEKSGSLITAELALDQGKDVVAVPGTIFSDQSKGTNKLIRDGAYIFTGFEDLFQILNMKYVRQNSKKLKEMTSIEKKIYDSITDTPAHIDDIFERTNVDIKQLYEVLFELQLRDEVICISGNYYARINKAL
ncbi:DNA-processing protein DprA [Clostridium sp. JS66]|uniref:DNA-processing protein DprA n=1 Tax=Clostridium sp. JS66 TaxID=3064705 RepID=UPI00298EB2FB|nr:DNA-processing protein DprA [Clostridium sp. JS66]WPC40698.1 DNA-processing protein DprA [Clostridium sp. JS66]